MPINSPYRPSVSPISSPLRIHLNSISPLITATNSFNLHLDSYQRNVDLLFVALAPIFSSPTTNQDELHLQTAIPFFYYTINREQQALCTKMNLLLVTTALLLSFTKPALCSLERLAHLPECTASTAGLTLCGAAPSYINDVFQCNNHTLRWDLVHTCTSPNAPCSNAICTPLMDRCEESATQCATLHSHGYDGVAVCRAGKWEIRDSCACTMDGASGARCVAPQGGNAEDMARPRACKKGDLVCLAENTEGKDGSVFRCNQYGMWRIVQNCSKWERCVDEPTPHCQWY
ncbi:hypothetical protein COCSADRAFT_161111 [Bipolaris sorokiniana ND90Pr]|uniref:Uncharacterized protein n=1 Tax=Cochliobolus sativus (strain ND90Pr / ATCC 201652) TaxID=665912 RepID=M2T3Y7_COCSN|nr:uncharacterized protein COCSADRAFT_161111 [Bipolaris sorokiniana ND90Pr]EMD63727.1 hypothetical protein COCSADRAFT_161111 [Bipolaris sorokiniana ND90Pr]